MKKNNFKKAFSLIELSIVILIIGILVAGVTQSSRLLSAMRIQSVKSLTMNSPVPSIQGLTMWFETSLDKNFATGSSGNYTDITSPDNNSSIAKWNDINPISSDKFNAVQPNTAEQPIFIENAINNLPVLRFSGNKFLSTTTAFFDSAFSVFLVLTRSSDGNWRCIISDINPSVSGKLCAGQDASNTWTLYQPFVVGVATSLSSAKNTPVIFEIHSKGINASNSLNVNLYLNSTSLASMTINSAYRGNSGAIGRADGGDFWSGDIAEIIVFKRMISNDERLDVEKYLAKKYGIKIS
jgi:prepilin-type N-terminal cleavage/methylation domain-containing protein